MSTVDIKDCTLVHVRALEKREAVNSRFILINLNMTMTELTIALDTGLKEKGYDYRIQTQPISYCMLYLASFASNEAASALSFARKYFHTFNNNKSRKVLGIEYTRSANEILTETALSLIKTG
jgi:hypothetical protein